MITALHTLRLHLLRHDLRWLERHAPERARPTRLAVRRLEQRLGILPTTDQVRRQVEQRAKAGLYQ